MSILEKWAANQIFGSTLPKQGQIKPDIIASYLLALKFYYIDRQLSLKSFDDPWIALIIKGGKWLFPSKKKNRLPITKDIFKKITIEAPLTVNNLNIDTTFKVAWAGFMQLGKITYTVAEAKKALFKDIRLTKSDISFAKGDQYAILRLKQSKTNVDHTGVQIMLAATGEPTCPVSALRRLFIQNLRLAEAPLFRLLFAAFFR